MDIEEGQTQNAIASRVLTPSGRLWRSKLLSQLVEPRGFSTPSFSARTKKARIAGPFFDSGAGCSLELTKLIGKFPDNWENTGSSAISTYIMYQEEHCFRDAEIVSSNLAVYGKTVTREVLPNSDPLSREFRKEKTICARGHLRAVLQIPCTNAGDRLGAMA